MENIDVTKHDATGILLIEAMIASAKRLDILELFTPIKGKVNVEMKINGVEVPIVASLEEAWARMVSVNDEYILKKAKELVMSAGLSKVQEAMSEAEWKITNALQQALEGK